MTRVRTTLRRPLDVRFWEKVDRRGPDECWLWTGATENFGYGVIARGAGERGVLRAHRVAWELHNGIPVPAGRSVLHRCDTPPCVNPAHLWIGTRGDNNRDRAAKGRGREARQRGAANTNARLTEEEVRQIVELVEGGCSQMEVAHRFGIKQPQVSRIIRRESWSHLWL